LKRRLRKYLGENQFGFRTGERNRDAAGMLRMISQRTTDVDEELKNCVLVA
jgi:hypothetical protein